MVGVVFVEGSGWSSCSGGVGRGSGGRAVRGSFRVCDLNGEICVLRGILRSIEGG